VTDWVSLKRVARLNYGDALNAQTESDGRYPVVGSGGVFGRHALSNFHAPGIVIGRKGSHGSVHWVPDQGFATDTTYFIDRTCTSADLRWLYYVLESVDLRGASQDVGVPGLSRESAYSVPIPAPPSLEEQRRIADFLDAETAIVDELVDLRRRQHLLLAERRFILVRELLSTGLNATAYKTTDLNWLPTCPVNWRLVPLRHITQCLDGRRIPLSAEQRSSRKGNYPYYGASGVVDLVDSYLFDEPLVLLGEDGAQLGNPSLPIAFYVEGKIWVNNHAHVLRPVGVDGRLLAEILNVFDRHTCLSGSTREKITNDAMKGILSAPGVSGDSVP
jgi:type I restriction enzyme, S subunit